MAPSLKTRAGRQHAGVDGAAATDELPTVHVGN
jgi:hypothetical protein